MFGVSSIHKAKTYLKSGALAMLVSCSACTKHSTRGIPMPKDIVEFSQPAAAKLIEKFEGAHKQSKTILIYDTKVRFLRESEIRNYTAISKRKLKEMVTLPDSIETFYQVYEGGADRAIQSVLQAGKETISHLLTVGHGNTGFDSIPIAGNVWLKKGDYISKFTADSLLNVSINQSDSVIRANLNNKTYSSLKPYEKDAFLSYLHNVNDTLLTKHNSNRAIPESFFECSNNGWKGKVQSKFNVRPSSKAAMTGITKRNLIQMIIYGNGEIYKDSFALKTFEKSLDVIANRGDKWRICDEIVNTAKDYGVDTVRLNKTKTAMEMHLGIRQKKR